MTAIPRCPVPHCGGRLVLDTDRLMCLLCSRAVAEPDLSMGEKLMSNATPEAEPHAGPRAPVDTAAIVARVLADLPLAGAVARVRESVAPEVGDCQGISDD